MHRIRAAAMQFVATAHVHVYLDIMAILQLNVDQNVQLTMTVIEERPVSIINALTHVKMLVVLTQYATSTTTSLFASAQHHFRETPL